MDKEGIDRKNFFEDKIFADRLTKIKTLEKSFKKPRSRMKKKSSGMKRISKKKSRKKIKAKTIKRIIKKPLKIKNKRDLYRINSKKGIIKEALGDLNREISNISKEKNKLKAQIKNADKNLQGFIGSEKELQYKIAQLIEKEASLKEERREMALREDVLSEKLSKIRRVKAELDSL